MPFLPSLPWYLPKNTLSDWTLVTSRSSMRFSTLTFGVIKQIYHVIEGYLRKIPVERMLNFTSQKAREIHSQDWYFSHIPLKNMLYLFNYTECLKRIDDRDVTSVQSDRVFFGKYHDREGKKGISFLHIPRQR